MILKYIFSPLDINKHTIIRTMAKSAWIAHLAKFRKEHPEINSKNMFGEAAKAYKRQAGGSAMGGNLSPESVHGLRGSGLDLDTQVATQYGGGKKSRKARSGKKSRKSGKKSRKSKSCKRR
jgi:hypothetical protein